jgi:hypothetical protein
MLKKICTFDSVERVATSSFANRASRCEIAGKKPLGFPYGVGIEICSQGAQRRRLEHIDAKSALRCGVNCGKLRIRERRSRVAHEQLADMRGHGHQGGANLHSGGGIRIELRGGFDVHRRCGVNVDGEKQQECKAKHACIVHSSSFWPANLKGAHALR